MILFAFTHSCRKLNTANPEVQKYLLDIATYWIKEFDIDGWRLDVANEVDHHFWKNSEKQLQKSKPDIYILERFGIPLKLTLQGDEFHAVMNYAFTDSIKGLFCKKKINSFTNGQWNESSANALQRSGEQGTFNLLDSHDTARILTLAKVTKN